MKKTIILFCVAIISISCVNTILKSYGVFDNQSKITSITNGEKSIVFIEINHIGKKEFYNDVKFKVDSLEAKDYSILYEQVILQSNLSKEDKNLYFLKIRKLGMYGLEFDTLNNKLFNFKLKEKLYKQPKYFKLGVDTLKSIRADVYLNDLIDLYEKENGNIVLDSCDFITKKESNYICEKSKFINKNYYLLDFRNKKVVEKINEEKNNKIAIIYGKAHVVGIIEILQKEDNRWRLIKK
jgi:hypothetical protein